MRNMIGDIVAVMGYMAVMGLIGCITAVGFIGCVEREDQVWSVTVQTDALWMEVPVNVNGGNT